jgi:hypothetical protein
VEAAERRVLFSPAGDESGFAAAAAHAFFTHSIQAAFRAEKVGKTRGKRTSGFLLCAKHR